MSAPLATASVTSSLSNQPGRAMVTARGHHFVVDSPPMLGGPNEEINPIDLLLSALATCGTFVCEKAAQELNLPLDLITVTVAGEFDPRGVCGEPVDPRLQAVRIRLAVSGPTQTQGAALVEAFQSRCPVYTTLARATPMTVELIVESAPDQQSKGKLMKILRCRELGFDCDQEIRAQSQEEVLREAAEHARQIHGVEVTSTLAAHVQSHIHDETIDDQT